MGALFDVLPSFQTNCGAIGLHEALECRSTDEYLTTLYGCLVKSRCTGVHCVTCTYSLQWISLVWVAQCLASMELLPDWALMRLEPCLLLHLWASASALYYSFWWENHLFPIRDQVDNVRVFGGIFWACILVAINHNNPILEPENPSLYNRWKINVTLWTKSMSFVHFQLWRFTFTSQLRIWWELVKIAYGGS